MKRTFKLSSLLVVCLMALLILAGCGGYKEKYANKINEAAENGEHMTYAKIEKKLGDPVTDLRYNGTGVCIWAKGMDKEEYEAALKNGDDVITITVTFASGKAQKAVYNDSSKE